MATKIVVNCETGETVEVELTAEELAQAEADRVAFEAEQALREAEAAAKEAAKVSGLEKLAALGLSEAEVSSLIG